MALSQLRCLDENHVNPRINASKPDFLYCEDQRLALETLLRDGREAFFKFLESRDLRGFLSDPELETLRALAEPYQPDSELFADSAEEGEPPLSLHYWPDLSDTSVPQMDLGWPDSESYRGVTRTTVYCQPPMDDQGHIKEVVRRMIAQAQKVIAVVMDVFTDVDIFRDLLDISFKKRVSVYILLDRTALPHFLSMCQRANMHTGHLKHLRIRCSGGSEFYTRSSTRVRGRLGHRFMFIDGDKAVSGSYSFTWMSSRLDRNHVTVVKGQAVETFDKLFRDLYANSSSVDLRQVAMESEPKAEPEKDPILLPATVAPTSAAIAMKLYNPKYALALCSPSSISSAPPAADRDSPKKTSEEISKDPEDRKKKRCRGAGREPLHDPLPVHPCLSSLEKVCLISLLPTWPEPDPPSDVIGFINIRDTSKPLQAHLQRSEMFETSRVIRFSSPISIPTEDLPVVAKPRQLTATEDKGKKLSQVQITAGLEPLAWPGDLKGQFENNTPSCEMQCRNTGYEQNIPSTTPEASSNCERLRPTTQAVAPVNSLIPPGSNAKVCDSNVISSGFTTAKISLLGCEPIGSTTGESVHALKMTPSLQTSNSSSHTHARLSSPNSPLLASSSPPIPKPRTVQLVVKDTVQDDGQTQQEVCVVRGQQSGAGPRVQDKPAAAMDLHPLKDSKNLQNGVETAREGKPGEAQNNVLGNYREIVIKEVVCDVNKQPESKQASKSGDLRADATQRVNDQDKVHRDNKSLLHLIASPQGGNTKRGVINFECHEVTRGNRKNAEQATTELSGGRAPQKMPQTAPTEGCTPALDTTSRAPVPDARNPNVLAHACTRADDGALDRPKITGELSPNSHASTCSPEIPRSSHLSKVPKKGLRFGIPATELPPPSPPRCTPSTPSPDPRLHAPGGTPDLRTPTSDISDECASPRTLSTTSDEYYECSDFPFNEAFERADVYSCDIREEDFRSSRANTANTSNISARADRVSTTEGNPWVLADPASISALFSLNHNMVKVEDENNWRESSAGDRREEKMTARNEPANKSPPSLLDPKVVKVEDVRNGSKLIDLEMRVGVGQRAGRRGGDESGSTTDAFKHSGHLTFIPSQEANGNSWSKAARLAAGRMTSEKMSEPSSTGDTREEKMMARISKRGGFKERSKRGAIKETEDQKLSLTPLPPDRGAGSPSPRTNLASWITDYPESPQRPAKPPAPPGEGQRQTTKPRQRHTKTPSPQSSTYRRQVTAPHPRPDSHRPTFPAEETQREVDGKTLFGSTFSHLYSLKDKINKLPAPRKRGSPSSSAQTHKSSG